MDSDSENESINSNYTLPEEDTNTINNFNEALQSYKNVMYKRFFPNDENGISQTSIPIDNYINTLKNDANILLSDDASADVANDDESYKMSDEATKYLLPFFSNNINSNQIINTSSLLRRNLLTYPLSRNTQHAVELKNNKQ
jgi:hypothetical protein